MAGRRAVTTRKGGDTDVLHYATGTARLLPKVINGRANGPLFLAERSPSLEPGTHCYRPRPRTGRARLSYHRAAEIFTDASDGATLHHLWHSTLTHLAEEGVPTVLLMAKSRHASLRTLQRYARPSVEAVARLTAEYDPLVQSSIAQFDPSPGPRSARRCPVYGTSGAHHRSHRRRPDH